MIATEDFAVKDAIVVDGAGFGNRSPDFDGFRGHRDSTFLLKM